MKYILLTLITLLSIQSNLFAKDTFSLGFGSIIRQNNFIKNDEADGDVTITNFPAIFWESGNFAMRGYDASYAFVKKSKEFDFGVKIKFAGDKYGNQHIKTRKQSFFGGIYYRLYFLNFTLTHDLKGSAGVLGDLFVIFPVKLIKGFWTLVPRFGVDFFSAQYVNHYYGISQSEAVEFATYKSSKGAANSYISLGNAFKFGDSLSARISLTYKHYGNNIENSPIVKKDDQFYGNVMLLYKFY